MRVKVKLKKTVARIFPAEAKSVIFLKEKCYVHGKIALSQKFSRFSVLLVSREATKFWAKSNF